MAGLSHWRSPMAYVNMPLPLAYQKKKKERKQIKAAKNPQIVLNIAWGKSEMLCNNKPACSGGGWRRTRGPKQDIYPIDFPRMKQEDLGGGLTLKTPWKLLRSELHLHLHTYMLWNGVRQRNRRCFRGRSPSLPYPGAFMGNVAYRFEQTPH